MDGSVVFAKLRQCAPHLVHASLDPLESISKRYLDRFSRFFPQVTANCPYTLRWAPFPFKIVPSRWGSRPPYMLPWVHLSPQPKQQIDRFSRFCRAHDRGRPTHHATPSVTIGRCCVYSTAPRPKSGLSLCEVE